MVFALEHVLQDQSRSMWTRAVMCKGLSQSCGKQGLPTGTARLFGDPKAGENLRSLEKSQKLGYIRGNSANHARLKKTLRFSKRSGD